LIHGNAVLTFLPDDCAPETLANAMVTSMRNYMLVTALMTAVAAPVHAQTPAPSPIQIENSWAPTSIGQSKTGVVYLTITNHDGALDRLVGASSPAAGKIELHMSEIRNGVARMQAMPKLELEPHQPVTLKPGGLHLMLVDLKAPLRLGGQVPITLTFERAAPVEVVVKVGPAPAAPDAGHAGHH
jgi:periplasmic copper chaperone A